MSAKWLSNPDYTEILSRLMQEYLLYAPVKNEKELTFQLMKDVSQIAIKGSSNTRFPPKSLFFPQSEVLMKYAGGLHSVENEEKDKMLFGIRPCDARAISLLDHAFDDEQAPDHYWQSKRDSAIVISYACLAPRETCFCTAVGGSPFDAAGADAQFVKLEDGFVVQVYSKRAEKIFADLPDAQKDMLKAVKTLSAQVIAGMPEALEKQQVHDKLLDLFESDFWRETSESCLGCGVCTFLCPTCFCFDIVDETLRKERVRNWDSCMFRIYSLEASGHNPRPTKSERTRQRVMHKYAYWVDQINEIGCTGCGRCVEFCPVNIDIREIVENALHRDSAGGAK